MIIHVDCNNYYVSCERIFRPYLRNKPVAVVTNNENGGGIILALSKEAKLLGLKRGAPVYKVKELLEKNEVTVFPTNFILYNDISSRVMSIVRESGLVLNIEKTSIDEFFGTLPVEDPKEAEAMAREVCRRITQATDIPVSCGCAATYTLAKVATWFVKHYPYPGVCVITEANREKALALLPVQDVWGIGRQHFKKLQYIGVRTALDFIRLKESRVQSLMTVVGAKTRKELRGIPCIDISELPQKKSICTSRSFSSMVIDKEEVKEAVANFTACCARKLRAQKSHCRSMTVFILTNSHREDLPQYWSSDSLHLKIPTSDTIELTKAAIQLFEQIFKEGYKYKKAGVIVTDIIPDTAVQQDLFDTTDRSRQQRIMKVMDHINDKYGADKVRILVQGLENNRWKVKGINDLRCFTTNINDILQLK